jgi:hypothetical protein
MSTRVSVIFFLAVSAFLLAFYGTPFFPGWVGKEVHLPGKTSDGHHQLEIACEKCHSPFGGVTNDACESCHRDELVAENNTHPVEKFADPRNADRAAGLDAQRCVTCHHEHVPDRTVASVTIAEDFCARCHMDVAEDRPSHASFAVTSCSSSGCHNFHDNRALYEDFLNKHQQEPDKLPIAISFPRTFLKGRKALSAKDQNAAGDVRPDPTLLAEWESTAHAKAGVNCGGCHQESDPSTGSTQWQKKIDRRSCAGCHLAEDAGFLKGKHGMRISAGLSPMTPETARLPMKAESKHEELGCNTCHRAHKFDSKYAAVDACLNCHDDDHSRGYKASKHYRLVELEREHKGDEGTGVTCATCHLPRETHKEGDQWITRVQHNQNDNLRPNDKMLRSVCMNCHGLGFSMDSLADPELVRRNFNGRSGKHVKSLEMAEKRLGEKSKKGE